MSAYTSDQLSAGARLVAYLLTLPDPAPTTEAVQEAATLPLRKPVDRARSSSAAKDTRKHTHRRSSKASIPALK